MFNLLAGGPIVSMSVWDNASSLFKNLYTGIGTVLVSAALFSIALVAFKLVFADGAQEAKAAKQRAIYICVACILYWMAPLAIDGIKALVSTSTTTTP